MTNDYFGGYIGKAQQTRHMEIKKCIDKMYTLRESKARDNKAWLQKGKTVKDRVLSRARVQSGIVYYEEKHS